MKLPSWLEEAVLADAKSGESIGIPSAGGQDRRLISVQVESTRLEHLSPLCAKVPEGFVETIGGELTRQVYVKFFEEVLEAKQQAFEYFAKQSVVLISETMEWLLDTQKEAWGSVLLQPQDSEFSFYEGVGRLSLGTSGIIKEAQTRAFEVFSEEVRKAEEAAVTAFYAAVRSLAFESFDELEQTEKGTTEIFYQEALQCAEMVLEDLTKAIGKAKDQLLHELEMIAKEGNFLPLEIPTSKEQREESAFCL